LKLLYNIFLFFYPLAARVLSTTNSKAKLWTEGRKDIFKQLSIAFEQNKSQVIWTHCASLGEFEQGRPVLEQLKTQYPNAKILITFFSPSGYEVQKNYNGADWIFYLPADSKKNAKRFLNIVKPSIAIFIKYEFWFYYLDALKQREIQAILVSGNFRLNQIFFKWYGSFYRNMLQLFSHLFIQNEESKFLLTTIDITENVTVSGDTRFDRVIEIAEQFSSIEAIEKFIQHNKVVVAGSTWTEDDEEINHYANTHQDIKFIIAPHIIEEDRMKECLKLYKKSILFSQWQQQTDNSNNQYNVLIIDNVGMLSRLYKYGTICFVGGAFDGDGVHNVLEAAVFGNPVFYGPIYKKYKEAADLIKLGGAISVENALELEQQFEALLHDESLCSSIGTKAAAYVYANKGATKFITNYIQENRLLTN
jgi:3-deoxy-D-manno-octulosonic-acid transferase